MRHQRKIIALNAVTATTVSDKYYVGDAVRVGLLLRRAANGGGTSAFTVKGSLQPLADGDGGVDSFGFNKGGSGVTMIAHNMLIDNVTNTNAQTLTRVNGKSIAASNGDVMLWLDPQFLMNWLEITVTETTDGTHSAFIIVETENESPIR
jgi:hypothetical protein